jgi:hypothetical protein
VVQGQGGKDGYASLRGELASGLLNVDTVINVLRRILCQVLEGFCFAVVQGQGVKDSYVSLRVEFLSWLLNG